MSNILIADSAEGCENLKRILGKEHVLVFANSTRAALESLGDQAFDLIFVGVEFDESRMFEFIPLIGTTRLNADTPVICFCSHDTQMTRTMHESLEVCTCAIGAWMYLDLHESDVYTGADAEVRRIIERCLAIEARKESLARRLDIHRRRTEIHQLRLSLESEHSQGEPELNRSTLKRRLSEILLELTRASADNELQGLAIKASRELNDRVSETVTAAEDLLTGQERNQIEMETSQSAEELELSERERRSH